jgi:hypothetical protein
LNTRYSCNFSFKFSVSDLIDPNIASDFDDFDDFTLRIFDRIIRSLNLNLFTGAPNPLVFPGVKFTPPQFVPEDGVIGALRIFRFDKYAVMTAFYI